ncbi:MAG TPA: TerB family tellurite resistance protein [Bauldia sp.]|nr:TerB family tellurite resistance protein [Bauldia sp.]
MTIWHRLGSIIDDGAGAVGSLIDWAGSLFAGDPAARRQVAFSVAMIALSAKMARADGVVTSDEVAAFRSIFVVVPSEERNVTRLFDLAQRDIAGFETYARRIAGLYGDDRPGLEDVVDGLFAIARADGAIHAAELAYLARVAEIFGLPPEEFERIASRHVIPEEGDPYVILGIARGTEFALIRRHYLGLVAENHPDRLIGRRLPPEAIALATERLAAINRAYERIERERR